MTVYLVDPNERSPISLQGTSPEDWIVFSHGDAELLEMMHLVGDERSLMQPQKETDEATADNRDSN